MLLNTKDTYYFETYPEKLTMRRTFKPHQVPKMKKQLKAENAAAAAGSKKSDTVAKSDTALVVSISVLVLPRST